MLNAGIFPWASNFGVIGLLSAGGRTMHPCASSMRRNRSVFGPTASFALLAVGAIGVAIALLLSVWQGVDDLRGGTVPGEVVDISSNYPGRRVYTVRFTTITGVSCESRIDSGSNPPPRAIQIGGLSEVHYRKSDPCSAVRETSEPAPWLATVITGAVLVGLLIAARSAWRSRRK
ncbi:DUF3592 domain-containing protein [Dactylosporangium sp. NPDC005572]|uniref:DUF3592 domain-containing protein n=1 Tax=Dactylosporangium sp. NPDC005572 TaxID=3156889 RepID=UPI0033AACB85